MVPFWALPSLIEFEIIISPSAAHFIIGNKLAKLESAKALAVVDPTLDLPTSVIEAHSITKYLSKLGVEVKYLQKENATEDALIKFLPGVSIFHFSGHGQSDLIQPIRSALLVYPGKNRLHDKDPFKKLVSSANKWQEVNENERYADLPGIGRLYEKLFPEQKKLERYFEFSESGTLWGSYETDEKQERLKKLAELWTAGDIMLEESLKNCKLAFLSACESGVDRGIDSNLDEYSGLPAALQLAGVSSVVSTLWPVSDVLTMLYVDLFYDLLVKYHQPVNIASVIRNVGERLRCMKKEEVVVLLNDLKNRISDPLTRYRLEAYGDKFLKAGSDTPFSHPYDWAPFFAVGSDKIMFSTNEGFS